MLQCILFAYMSVPTYLPTNRPTHNVGYTAKNFFGEKLDFFVQQMSVKELLCLQTEMGKLYCTICIYEVYFISILHPL